MTLAQRQAMQGRKPGMFNFEKKYRMRKPEMKDAATQTTPGRDRERRHRHREERRKQREKDREKERERAKLSNSPDKPEPLHIADQN